MWVCHLEKYWKQVLGLALNSGGVTVSGMILKVILLVFYHIEHLC